MGGGARRGCNSTATWLKKQDTTEMNKGKLGSGLSETNQV
jgi:hypothetical protein